MPDANVELVQRSWDASLAADWPAVLATLHPEAEIRDFDVPDSDIGRGHEGFFTFLGRSGLELERQDAIVYRVEDGQIVYMAYYNDQEQAFEALRRAA